MNAEFQTINHLTLVRLALMLRLIAIEHLTEFSECWLNNE